VLTALLYGQTLDDPWHFDDRSEITPKIREFAPALDASHYRGIVVRWLWALDYRLHGDDPAGYHVTNGLIHAANAILVYWIAWMLGASLPAMGIAAPGLLARRRFGALASATVFCVHPLATQSVTYVTQRSTSIAAFFFLFALGSWIRFRDGVDLGLRRWAFALIALLSFAIGLYTKHVVVMLPGMLIAFELLFRPARRRLALLLLLPFVVLAVWRSLEYIPSIQRSIRSVAAPGQMAKPGAPPSGLAARPDSTAKDTSVPAGRSHTAAEYAFTQPRCVLTYLRLFFWPRGQNLDWDVRPSRSPQEPVVLGSLVILAALAYVAWRVRRRHPTIPFGFALFLLTLVPTSSFVRSADLLFEHRAYLPMVGLCLGFGDLATIAHRCRPRAALVGLAVVVAALSVATWRRNAVWDSELSLWSDVVMKSPNRVRGHVNLGLAWQRAGRLDEAEKQYRRALEIAPNYPAAMNDLGNVLRRRGRIAEAETVYQELIERNPRAVEPRINLGNLAVDRGDFASAEQYYRAALDLAPGDMGAHYNLAKSLEGQGRMAEAVREYELLTGEHPENAQFFNDLGAARILTGDAPEAERDLRRAIALRGDWEVPWYNLGVALEAEGRVEEAVASFRKSLVIHPEFAPARERLAHLAPPDEQNR
jgi:tetratricopeptide (TPR) repeat protein